MDSSLQAQLTQTCIDKLDNSSDLRQYIENDLRTNEERLNQVYKSLYASLVPIQQRQPRPGLLLHSDRGSQYASSEYHQLLARHGITCSMSRKGNSWDNAVMEGSS